MRARMSSDAPAGNDTTMVTGRVGQDCADAALEAIIRTATPAVRCTRWRQENLTMRPPIFRGHNQCTCVVPRGDTRIRRLVLCSESPPAHGMALPGKTRTSVRRAGCWTVRLHQASACAEGA